MKRRIIMMIVSCLLAITCLSGCTTKTINVCYTAYPIEYLLTRIAGNRINLNKLSDENPIQVAHIVDNYTEYLDNATLILQLNELEPYWGIYAEEIKASPATIIDLTSLAAIYDFKRYTTGDVNGNSVVVEGPYYEGTEFTMTDIYSKDPNLWLDPIAMTSMARTIKDWLAEANPENAEFYETNFKLLEADLVRMDAEYSELPDNNTIKLVTVTPSFGNWQKAYGIGIYPLILSRYGALPTEAQLTIMETKIRDDKVQYIVKEANLTEDMLALYERVKQDCGLIEIELSNLSSLSEKEISQNKDYLTIMYDNLTVLEKLK
ncbi:MAG: zinc ABC transporter substrate-binding protein [Erysipelotrichaceae bacterium]|nr:zinc ABC transporter substrate-binding protein [Erysipelotrichaceae bacterium]